MIHWVLLISRQGKVRLAKWFDASSEAQRATVVRDVCALVLTRGTCVDCGDNELLTMETLHLYVESLDRYFGSVCELDLIFNFTRAYWMLSEILAAGEMQESSKTAILAAIARSDSEAEHAPEFNAKRAAQNSAPTNSRRV